MNRKILIFNSPNSDIDEITIRDEALFLHDNSNDYEEIESNKSFTFSELPTFENISNRRERDFLR